MYQRKKWFWWGCGVVGLYCCAAAALLFFLKDHTSLIGICTLVCTFAGGAFLIYLCVRALCRLRSLPEPTPQKKGLAPLAPDRLQKAARWALSAVVLTISALIFFFSYEDAQKTENIVQSTVQEGIEYHRGKVVSVDEEVYQGQQDVEDVPIGKQTVTVEMLSGPSKGKRYSLRNDLSYLYGCILKEGDHVIVTFSVNDGEVTQVLLQDYDRTIPLLLVVLAFLVITVLVGGKVGAKSLLGLGFTILWIFAVLIPKLVGGADTLPTILLMCTYVTVVEFVILDGVNRKTICAILGTMSGVVFAMLFGQIASYFCRVNGFLMYVAEPTVEALLQMKQGQDPFASIQIKDLLVGGILIAALGAVNDVAMSISSALNELITVNPDLSRRKLLRSGMNIGRDMVGTMTNTLILALVGSSLVLMIYLSSRSPSFSQLMSTTFLSVEMVQMLASSAGVILAVPMSVVFGALLFGPMPKRKKIRK